VDRIATSAAKSGGWIVACARQEKLVVAGPVIRRPI
jgi:hypothetical protein